MFSNGMRFKDLKYKLANNFCEFKKISPEIRKLFLILNDFFAILASILLAIILTDKNFQINLYTNIKVLIIPVLIGIPLYIFTFQYRSLSGYFRSELMFSFLKRNLLFIILIIFVGRLADDNFPSIRFWSVFFLINTFLVVGSRLIIKDLIFYTNLRNLKDPPKVVIYGAGSAGAQLASSISLSRSYQIEAFIDDDPTLWKRTLNSKKIVPNEEIDNLKSKIEYIFIAIPSLGRSRKKNLINSLAKYNVPILEIPSIEELTLGKAKISTLRPIDLDDLLGRETLLKRNQLKGEKFLNSQILVTGAGGSIGSELCRQIITFKLDKLILLESNELALFNLMKELHQINLNKINIVPILGNATNEILLKDIFQNNQIQMVFHAAAYKHVPLVESNPIEGLLNNVLSTYLICKISKDNTPNDVILISSDKAVRPANIMGASKRLSELIFTFFSQETNKKFSVVRFGNVIGSSGSVVPEFKKQIERGGPIEVTHPEIIRYFMTINEACGLVLKTIELSEGGDIFLLDMGEPVKIIDLAKQMILLSGLQLKDSSNPEGDIEITITGLRPGEKLFEELLIDGRSSPTKHPLIFRANEKNKISENFLIQLMHLINFLKIRDKVNALSLLSNLIPEWTNSNS